MTSIFQERNYVPSEEMGDYEELRKKKSPKTGPLYPMYIMRQRINDDFYANRDKSTWCDNLFKVIMPELADSKA